MKTHLLVDGDCLVYRFAAGEETPIRWERDLWTLHAFEAPGKSKLDSFLEWLVEWTEADRFTIFLSDPGDSFRKEVYPSYKGNRAGIRRPILWRPLRNHLENYYGALWEEKLEGDDMLALWATEHRDHPEERIVASIDKDLLTVCAKVVNWDKQEDGIREVSPEEALRFFYQQVLSGDRVDGYPGCPKLGDVRAERLVRDAPLDTIWEDVIVPQYEKAGLGEEFALTMARCAHLLQGDEFDEETKEIKLWTPPNR